MTYHEDRNWDLIQQVISAESSGKSPRLFSSKRTLFGIPSALDQELQAISEPQKLKKDANVNSKTSHKEALSTSLKEGDSANAETLSKRTQDSTKSTKVISPLKPVFNENSKTLILGTMPSPKSRETNFYYNNPQNRFWRVLAAVFNEKVPQKNEDKEALILRHNLALWDVLAECEIEGAKDATIANCVPNNIANLLTQAQINRIFCTGSKAYELYVKYCEKQTGILAVKLPSTSPANAAKSLEDLVCAYKVLADIL